MIKQKVNKIEKAFSEIKEANRRFIPITRWINRKDKPECYEYQNKKYNTLGGLYRDNNITDEDDILHIDMIAVYTKEDVEKYKNFK